MDILSLCTEASRASDMFVSDLQHRSLDLCHFPTTSTHLRTAKKVDISLFRPVSLLGDVPRNRSCPELGIAVGTCGSQWTETYYCSGFEDMSPSTQELLGLGDAVVVSDCTAWLPLMYFAVSHLNMELTMLLYPEILFPELNSAPRRAEDLPCISTLTRGDIEFVKTNDELSQCLLRFSIREGRPPRIFEATFDLSGASKVIALTQVTQYKRYEGCAPQGMAHMCICGEDKKLIDAQRRLDMDCWMDGYSEERCCRGPEGNPACFDGAWTFERCCGDLAFFR
ncbi:unnamed protein product [Polarella glacialis]|uniref:Uncharacterized protein n=1 Tax=Polarella glacialis TaxID=89957 RepID=A0A813GKE6_POLGL|nr:unnamed protein product [Polarella glacialis]